MTLLIIFGSRLVFHRHCPTTALTKAWIPRERENISYSLHDLIEICGASGDLIMNIEFRCIQSNRNEGYKHISTSCSSSRFPALSLSVNSCSIQSSHELLPMCPYGSIENGWGWNSTFVSNAHRWPCLIYLSNMSGVGGRLRMARAWLQISLIADLNAAAHFTDLWARQPWIDEAEHEAWVDSLWERSTNSDVATLACRDAW